MVKQHSSGGKAELQLRETEDWSNKTLRSRAAAFKKRKKRETAGSQESTKRPRNSSQLRDSAKRGGEQFVIGKADKRARQRGGERKTEVAA